MILADTSLWVAHLRQPNRHLNELLAAEQVISHAFIFGELLLGNTMQRQKVAAQLSQLYQATPAHDDEVFDFIRRHRLWERGIGYVDAYLLVSTALTPGALLWSRDGRLSAAALDLRLAYAPR